MRRFRVWGGTKPSVDNKNFIIAWGENRTNPTYWAISPQSSLIQLESPTCTTAYITGSSDHSYGTYTFIIQNNNVEDAMFHGMIAITPVGGSTSYNSISFFIPGGGGSYKYSFISQAITIGEVQAEILNAYFTGVDSLSTLSPGVTLGYTATNITTSTVKVTIPAFKPGFSSVKYTYTKPNGSSATVYASTSGQQQITVKANTNITTVETATSGCLCSGNNSSTYTHSVYIPNDILTYSFIAPTAKYARPIQSSHTVSETGITVYFTTNFSTSINCKVARVASNGSHNIIGTENTISIRKGTNTSTFISGPCSTVLYFRFYIPAQNGILASDYVWDYWGTSECSGT